MTPTDRARANYREMKSRDPALILLFRMGAFCRAFAEDASTIKAMLDEKQFPLWTSGDTAAFGASRLEEVLALIVADGKRAAVLEPTS